MAELTADLFVSAGGYALGENTGPYFGYGGPDLDRWVEGQLGQPHLDVIGRVTYEALAAMSATSDDPASTRMTAQPKAVVSNTLREPLTWPNTRLLRGDAGAAITALKRESEVPLRAVGSLSLVRSLFGLGLADRLRLAVFPVVLGPDGREPWHAGYPRAALDLVASAVLDGRIALLEYAPAA
ncbi:MAG TPA: dihydrofolate reductase family protein [Streptosporangiaceae bacterium]|jgi:dihydrofolate reductase|nr:dihydrofolate reductase family protein [Streptosporangiaceae bacterium]